MPDEEISTSVEVRVSYDSDLDKVERVTISVAREITREAKRGIPSFEPSIGYYKFGDSSINFNVSLRVKEFVDQYEIRHELIKRLHKRYRLEGIDIPYPVRTVYMKE